MNNVMFIGDLHISDKAPRSRKEEDEQYRQLILDKLNFCYEYCSIKVNDVKYVIILGDVFNSSINIYPPYLTQVYKVFQKFKDLGIKVYSIIGNHDMYYQNESEFDKTTLYQAFSLGLIEHLDTLQIHDTIITGVDYGKPIPKIKEPINKNILVGHCFYENTLFTGNDNTNLTDEQCKELGYKVYVLGHDHTYYPTIDTGEYRIVRPGSLIRGTSKTCNLYRDVIVDIYDPTTYEWKEVKVPIKPGTEVFNEKVIMSKSEDLTLNLENIIANLDYSSTANEYDILDRNEENGRKELKENYEPVVELITQYLEAEGIYRKVDNLEN